MFNRLMGRRSESPAHRVVIFHFGRCGSQVLAHLLESHPRITWEGELFHRLHEKKLTPAEQKAFADPIAELSRRVRSAGSQCYGFETKFQHLWPGGLRMQLDEYLAAMKNVGFNRFVLLRRRHYLRQAISIRRGMHSRKWHYAKGIDTPPPQAIHLDPANVVLGGPAKPLLDRFREVDSVYARAEQLFAAESFLQLAYEDDICGDPTIAYRKLCEFADLEYVPGEPDLQQIGGQPLPELLDNFDEIAAILRGTEFEWMLEEGESRKDEGGTG